MTKALSRTPRWQHPLAAVLAGAGFFIFLAVLGALGPLGAWDRALWQARQPGQPLPAAGSALRLRGSPLALSPSARALGLAEDVAWLRSHGVGAIVVEAWLDEAPQADARALEQDLRQRLQALPQGRTKKAALLALSESASALDAPDKLAQALSAAQPLLLAFSAVPGQSTPLPEPLRRQAYEVTLHGKRQALPPQQPLHLPYAQALEAVGRAGAVPDATTGEDRLPVVLEIDGRWFNTLGLEAARLSLGLPLDAQRYRWKQGVLSSLELKGVRYPLDNEGRLALPSRHPELEELDLGLVKEDPSLQARLAGKLIFLRPWPKLLGDASAFDQQERLYMALVERDVMVPSASGSQRLLWLGLWALGLLLLARAPIWAGVLGWSALPLLALWAFSQDPQSLTQPWGLAVSGLLLGAGWRLQRAQSRSQQAVELVGGRTAASHQVAWRERLAVGKGSVDAAYAVVGPRSELQGKGFEAWMDRWGAMVDEEVGVNGLGLILPDLSQAPVALADLRQGSAVACGVAHGVISFQLGQRLGAPAWQWSGPVRDEAIALFHQAKPKQILLLERDYQVWRGSVQIQLIGQSSEGGLGKGGGQVLNLLALIQKM